MSTPLRSRVSTAGSPSILPYSKLVFPLNVYALLLEWTTGSADHLHYGLFEQPDEPIEAAQLRAAGLLRSRLPAAGKVLEVGCGFGWLTDRLLEAGYDITGITPDEAQIAIARARFGERLPVRCCRLENFFEEEGRWDAIVFHESGQYIPMLQLFERVSRLLAPGGQILVLDEFACRRSEPGQETLHHKGHFIALAKRFGFSCVEEVDCTKAAAPTLDFLLHQLATHRDALRKVEEIQRGGADYLLASNQAYREKYHDGRFGYFLIHLQRQSDPKWRLARITEKDQPAVEALFAKVFSDSMPLAFWQWKYGPERGEAVGLWQEGELIAHYGGTRRLFRHEARDWMASQSCDVMVAPQVRGVFTRHGPFFLVAATFLEQHVGYGTPHPLAFGFPNERAFLLPFKLGLYSEPVTRVCEAAWRASKLSSTTIRFRELEPGRDQGVLDRLWLQMTRDLDHLVVGVRDSGYWRARYREHPKYLYRLVLAYHRWLRRPLAALAVKDDGDRLELIDWVAGVRHIPAVITVAKALAFSKGRKEVFLWASEPVVGYLQETAPLERDLNIVVPTNGWTDSPPVSLLKGKFWLTGGDTDFH